MRLVGIRAMENLEQIYDDEFFEKWGRTNGDYVASVKLITEVLYEQFRPDRIVDLGCGCGAYGHFFKEKGVEVVCIDGVEAPARSAFPVNIEFDEF